VKIVRALQVSLLDMEPTEDEPAEDQKPAKKEGQVS
jgi:hypothetical protein